MKYPKPKKVKLSKLKKRAEDAVKLAAKKRDNYTCQKCRKIVFGSNAHASHVIPVSHGNVLRFDLRNIICLCYHCHINWWHKNPREASVWYEKKYPKDAAYQDKMKDVIVQLEVEDYMRIIKKYS